MADINILQQENMLLNLRVTKLEDDKKKLSEQLKNTEKVCKVAELAHTALKSKYDNALEKIDQLKEELINVLGSEADESSEDYVEDDMTIQDDKSYQEDDE